MTTTFETAKVGDKVWCMKSGWGEIRETDYSSRYPIYVVFSRDEFKTYTAGGLHETDDKVQTLFWGEVVIDAPLKPRTDSALLADEKQISALRDQIAIAYMQSCVAGNAYFETFEGVSEEAYKMADLMLKERDK